MSYRRNGSGKSIVIGAISLLLGERAAAEQVRLGAERRRSKVSSRSLRLAPRDGRPPGIRRHRSHDLLILGRELSRSGRSVGGSAARAVPVSFLKELGATSLTCTVSTSTSPCCGRRNSCSSWTPTAGSRSSGSGRRWPAFTGSARPAAAPWKPWAGTAPSGSGGWICWSTSWRRSRRQS